MTLLESNNCVHLTINKKTLKYGGVVIYSQKADLINMQYHGQAVNLSPGRFRDKWYVKIYNDCQIHQYLDLHKEISIHFQHLEICQVSKGCLKVDYGGYAIGWSTPYVPGSLSNGTTCTKFWRQIGLWHLQYKIWKADWARQCFSTSQ